MIINFIKFIKAHLHPKKIIFRNAIITLIIVFVLLLFDQLIKNLIFTNDEYEIGFYNNENLIIDWKIVGFRPLLHHGVTSGLQNVFGFWLIHFFSVLMIIITIGGIFFIKDVAIIVALAILMGGNLGNMVDRIAYDNSVKDYLFLPFYDRGTFNIADIYIVVGALLVPVSMLVRYGWLKLQKHKEKELKFDE